ncbi:hypothetical protein [Ligilactobacillus acidipiscis]|uniref:hypothetical protein n=1 Tax=Ligilactobacillus acidipiscis TaxID=89059 RepID=UPI0022E89594|nr:hypothetical protein [Ligilactobacillus acidipiscis]
MNGDDLNVVVKKAKVQGRTVELLEYVLSKTDCNREPKAHWKLAAMAEKERKLAHELL